MCATGGVESQYGQCPNIYVFSYSGAPLSHCSSPSSEFSCHCIVSMKMKKMKMKLSNKWKEVIACDVPLVAMFVLLLIYTYIQINHSTSMWNGFSWQWWKKLVVNQQTAARGRLNVVDTGSRPNTTPIRHNYYTNTTRILHNYVI